MLDFQISTKEITGSARPLSRPNIFKPVWSTILFVQPLLPIGEASRNTTLTFRRIWAVKEGDMLIPNVTKPMITITSAS